MTFILGFIFTIFLIKYFFLYIASFVVDNRCRLADLEEGRIGKLQIHRSGKVTLALGDTLFEVCMGTKPSFYQEAVSVGIDEASRSANIVALGPLQHKLNLLPHWETMFRDLPT